MATQTFSAGTNPRISLADCEGDVLIEAWDERSIAIEAEEGAVTPSQEGETLAIRGARGRLHLRVPGETAVTVQGQRGGVHLRSLYGAAQVQALSRSGSRATATGAAGCGRGAGIRTTWRCATSARSISIM
jgi:hypothetical protein